VNFDSLNYVISIQIYYILRLLGRKEELDHQYSK